MVNKKQYSIIVLCPWCNGMIVILSLNCGIFRHGIYRKNMNQIPPHASKNVCDRLIRENKIYGCGKPFRVSKGIISKCNYI